MGARLRPLDAQDREGRGSCATSCRRARPIHAYPESGIDPDGDAGRSHTARHLLWGAQCNAAFLLDESRSDEEVVRYLERWTFMNEKEALRVLPSPRRPFAEAYIFCYDHGRKLLEPRMEGPDRYGFVRRLLTEQLCPSDL